MTPDKVKHWCMGIGGPRSLKKTTHKTWDATVSAYRKAIRSKPSTVVVWAVMEDGRQVTCWGYSEPDIHITMDPGDFYPIPARISEQG